MQADLYNGHIMDFVLFCWGQAAGYQPRPQAGG